MASMLDEPQAQEVPKWHVCPCCLLSFRMLEEFETHLLKMEKIVVGALEKTQRALLRQARLGVVDP